MSTLFANSYLVGRVRCSATMTGHQRNSWRGLLDRWLASSERMHRRSKIVQETGERQFHAAGGAAGCRLRLENLYTQSCLGQDDGCRQSIRTRANNTCVAAHRQSPCDCRFCTIGSPPSCSSVFNESLTAANRILCIIVSMAHSAIRSL